MDKLLGKWELVEGTGFEKATMHIYDDGKLVYVIPQDDRNQVILLNFKVEGNVLITDQPSHPKEERTVYEFLEDGRLKTETNGESGIWKKSELTKDDVNWQNYYNEIEVADKANKRFNAIFVFVLISIFALAIVAAIKIIN